ncbi:MAG TPA: outer membrane protein transport protein [Thermoanaerobaculia bacterium]
MRQRFVLLCLLAGLLRTDLAAASGYGLFQHGGRAMGQAGAFTARASEPSAVTYNPAAITQLSGLQVQAGLDLSNSETKYISSTGSFSAKHIIDFPPTLYLTWKAREAPIALGIGLDSPFWSRMDWEPALFPGRFLTRAFELRVAELHSVLAYDLGEGWSVAGGLRYVYGSLEQGDNELFQVTSQGQIFDVEVERTSDADVDAFAWDLAVHYAAPSWGWGGVFRSPARLKGNGDVSYDVRDLPNPALETQIRNFLQSGSARQAFEIPREIRAGTWFAPYPELRIELDLAYQSWSSLDETSITFSPDLLRQSPLVTPRDWEDTLAIRLGLEGNITDNFLLFGGVGYEPSPVGDRVEPGFPRGDATIYAAGFSYNFPQVSFDVGYSFHDHDPQGASRQEPSPLVSGTYSGTAQVWGFSVRRRW